MNANYNGIKRILMSLFRRVKLKQHKDLSKIQSHKGFFLERSGKFLEKILQIFRDILEITNSYNLYSRLITVKASVPLTLTLVGSV